MKGWCVMLFFALSLDDVEETIGCQFIYIETGEADGVRFENISKH